MYITAAVLFALRVEQNLIYYWSNGKTFFSTQSLTMPSQFSFKKLH